MSDIPSHLIELAKRAHNSLSIRWGTLAPYRIEKARAERIGYADIRCLVVTVYCRDEDLSALVPVTRQHVYRELAERGWGPDDIDFHPSTQMGRRRRFVDDNESSESYGKNKFGTEYRFSFEMGPELRAATFVGGGSFKPLPTKEAT